jgi:hypothetical protein
LDPDFEMKMSVFAFGFGTDCGWMLHDDSSGFDEV